MKHITYTCDKCGKKIKDIRKIHIFGMDEREITSAIAEYDPANDADLCEACMGEIHKMIVGFVYEQDTKEVQNKQKPEKRVDSGKIIALRKAGWKVKDIAEDVGASEATVYNVLKKWREQEETTTTDAEGDIGENLE